MPQRVQQRLRMKGKTTTIWQPPTPVKFSVPAQVKHLDAEQLVVLTESFRTWYRESPRPADRRARGRVWLTYLFIRFTGAKLGEVLAIDDQADLKVGQGTLKLGSGRGGEPTREVQLPPDVIEE
ncbi:MAG: hypothetical protein ABH877_00375, partial [bacterium]